MNLAELLQPWVTLSATISISGLQNNSRQVKPGDLFFAYQGAQSDGRRFMHHAQSAGAAAIVYDPFNFPENIELTHQIPTIPIPFLSTELANIASRFYRHPTRRLRITGVTGTNGKTTIAYQLAMAHGLLGERAAYLGTLGQGDIDALQPLANTTPDALQIQALLSEYQLSGTQQVCMEVSSHGLVQGRVACIDFSQAIFSNLSHDHLDYHHTMEDYAKAKALLFTVPSLKTAIINRDDAFAQTMLANCPKSCDVLTYGFGLEADVRASNEHITASGSQFEVTSPWGQYVLQTKSLGYFNIYNSLAVLTSLLAQGYNPSDVISVMARLNSSPGRMQVVQYNPCVIIDYAHTPDALKNVLMTLNQIKTARLIVVFGCGGQRDSAKRPMMGRIASEYSDVVILTSDNPRNELPSDIIEAIASGLLPSSQAHRIIDRKEAIHFALKMANQHDIVLIAGKGHEAYQQIGNDYVTFSDKDVVLENI